MYEEIKERKEQMNPVLVAFLGVLGVILGLITLAVLGYILGNSFTTGKLDAIESYEERKANKQL